MPVDISDMSPIEQWKKLALTINENYRKVSGFVVIMNLRYLPHIAAGLSYSFENLAKPVILTGGVRQIYMCNNDSSPNLSGSLLLASFFHIPEVGVFSNGKLLRGNRVIRSSCNSTGAFDSPNYPPLATVDSEISIHWDKILNLPIASEEFGINLNFNEDVEHFVVTPELNDVTIEEVYSSFTPSEDPDGFRRRGVIMESFGNGNIRKGSRLYKIIGDYKEKGCLTFNVTQCHQGSVLDFEVNAAINAGAINCGDLVPPAAFAKVSQILSDDVKLAKLGTHCRAD